MASLALKRPNGYSKMDKEDPEERNHRRAQFLIYKSMDRVDSMSRKRPSYLRIKIRRLKVRVGKRLTKLRKSMLMTISTARLSVCKQICVQFKTCKKLFASAGEGQNRNNIVALPHLLR